MSSLPEIGNLIGAKPIMNPRYGEIMKNAEIVAARIRESGLTNPAADLCQIVKSFLVTVELMKGSGELDDIQQARLKILVVSFTSLFQLYCAEIAEKILIINMDGAREKQRKALDFLRNVLANPEKVMEFLSSFGSTNA